MRSGEISRLTMNDVVSIADELTIYIRQGKTPSAKRAIPLHLIAPPKVVSFIQDYCETRKSYYRAYRKKSIRSKNEYLILNEAPFIGLKIKEFNSDSGVIAARYNLATLQSIFGGAANFHLLRYSFASHIFLRWYCCKHPDLVKSLCNYPVK